MRRKQVSRRSSLVRIMIVARLELCIQRMQQVRKHGSGKRSLWLCTCKITVTRVCSAPTAGSALHWGGIVQGRNRNNYDFDYGFLMLLYILTLYLNQKPIIVIHSLGGLP